MSSYYEFTVQIYHPDENLVVDLYNRIKKKTEIATDMCGFSVLWKIDRKVIQCE